MIVRFEVENFFSLYDRQVLDLRLPETTPDIPERFVRFDFGEEIRVPKVAAIFGANASGKTSILRSIAWLVDFTYASFRDYEPGSPIGVIPFNDLGSQKRDTKFLLEFVGFDIDTMTSALYRYELHISREPTNHVSFEDLRMTGSDGTNTRFFTRTGDAEASQVKAFDGLDLKSSDPRLNVRTNVSLISSLEQFAHKQATKLVELFRSNFHMNVYMTKFEHTERRTARLYQNSEYLLSRLNQRIRRADFGIENIRIEVKDEKPEALLKHSGLDFDTTFYFESQGTKNFIHIFPDLAIATYMGGIAVMDEIDSDLHPALMPEILDWFYFAEAPFPSQMIMTGHNASLLSSLEKEEVWFVAKGNNGRSSLYPLRKFQGLRRGANLYKKYLSGLFGAVPRLG